MRIPKRVNTAWDWAEANQRVLLIVTALLVAAAALRWIPALSTFVAGLAVGGLAVHRPMARRVARLRAEVDGLLRENGALQHQKTLLATGVLSSQGMLTQGIPVIGEEEPEFRLPANGSAAEPPALRTQRLPAVPEEPGQEDAAATTRRLPALPDDGETGGA